ncbi:MAG: biosynthetic arginine decarboxylase [Pseudomonadota bacterium]
MSDWNIQKSRDLYNIPHWSGGYFDINARGHLVARPNRDPASPGADIYRIAQELKQSGLALPIMMRFTGILHDRVDSLCQAFAKAMQDNAYQARYTAVYPIKVNQQRSIVQEILGHGGERVGLEAGSKPELMAVLGLSNPNGGIIVCNGYKDREYIRLALIGRSLGHQIFIVVEKLSELELVIKESQDLGIAPLLGVRARMSSIGAGKWQNTGGEKSKFGLSAAQVLQMAERLKQVGMLETLQLLHFHLGSQIANIRDIQRGMREAARNFAELHRLGANIKTVDVGGGLGVDYEGTRSRSFCSMNYGLNEYAYNVVHALKEICETHALPHPNIITEAGRAMTAHHAILVADVIDHEIITPQSNPAAPDQDEAALIQDLWHGLQLLNSPEQNARSAIEIYHDAAHLVGEAQSLYTHGVFTLEQRARAEQLYFATCDKVRAQLRHDSRSQREILDELNEKLTDKYFVNFSLFQSIPDVWAIDQIFPIMPLHRLTEQPNRRAVLTDITCDSDGRIDYYVDSEGIEASLPLHALQEGQPYLLAFFLVGAYQEILGDMHNLFGDTDSVHVDVKPDGSYELKNPLQGDTVDSVLRYVHFEAEELLQYYRQKVAQAPLSNTQRAQYLEELEAGLRGYTYLEE